MLIMKNLNLILAFTFSLFTSLNAQSLKKQKIYVFSNKNRLIDSVYSDDYGNISLEKLAVGTYLISPKRTVNNKKLSVQRTKSQVSFNVKTQFKPEENKNLSKTAKYSGRGKSLTGLAPSMASPMTLSSKMSERDVSMDESGMVEKSENHAKSGVLTAGLWTDLEHWSDFLATDSMEQGKNAQKEWGFHLNSKRFSVEIIDKNKQKVVGKTLLLLDHTNTVVWKCQTDNRGFAELWHNPFSDQKMYASKLKLFLVDGDKKIALGKIDAYTGSRETFMYNGEFKASEEVNICFLVDATGSMGDEIQFLKAEVSNLILNVQASAPCATFKMASVFYKDNYDEYVTSSSDFTDRIDDLQEFISKHNAGGGGDFPEAVDAGLEVALNTLSWSETASTKIIFLILDAPPHADKNIQIQQLVKLSAEKGIKIIPIVASGINKSTEYLMKYMAAITQGDYVYLSDHSGIGNSHIKPTGIKENIDLLENKLKEIILKYTYNKNCDLDSIQKQNIQPRTDIFGNDQIVLQCYPNPATSFINIKANTPIETIELYELSGKLIVNDLNVKLNFKNEYTLILPKMADGIYVLKVRVGKETFQNKILVLKGQRID